MEEHVVLPVQQHIDRPPAKAAVGFLEPAARYCKNFFECLFELKGSSLMKMMNSKNLRWKQSSDDERSGGGRGILLPSPCHGSHDCGP
jgi:hypothetical protein